MTTIAQERAGHSRVGYDDMITREAAGFRFDDYDEARSVDEPADTQHVHITITNPGNYSSDAAHARGVEAIGIARFPNTGVSYNRLVMQSGRVYEGQPIGRRGAHTVNDFKRPTCTTSGCPGRGGSLRAPSWNNNITGRAYVICQNVDDEVTNAQLDAMARVMAADRLAGFVRMDARIHGHRCCSAKSCPGNRMWARMGELKKLVDHYVRVGFGAGTPGGDDSMSAADVAKLEKRLDSLEASLSTLIRGTSATSGTDLTNGPKAVWNYYLVENPVTGEPEPIFKAVGYAAKYSTQAFLRSADNQKATAQLAAQVAALQELVVNIDGGVTEADLARVRAAAQAGANAAIEQRIDDARVELVVAREAEDN